MAFAIPSLALNASAFINGLIIVSFPIIYTFVVNAFKSKAGVSLRYFAA
jgi:hypothetical protein